MNDFNIHFTGRPDDLLEASDASFISSSMHQRQGTCRDAVRHVKQGGDLFSMRAVTVTGISGGIFPSTGVAGGGARFSAKEHRR